MSNKFFAALPCIIFLFFLLSGCGGGSDSLSSGSNNSYGGGGTYSAMLSWDAPTTNEDGTPLTDLAGYKMYYGPSSDNYTRSIDVGNNRHVMIDNLSSGSWCFATSAYDVSGNESTHSNEVCTYL